MVTQEQISAESTGAPELSTDAALALLRSMRQITHALDVQSKRLMRSTGLSTPQLIVLQAVAELGEVTTRTIARHISLTQAAVTTLLDRLERQGFIERYRSTADRRVVHTRLTERGATAVTQAPPLLHETFMAAFDALSTRRQNEIITALRDVGAMMSIDGSDAPSVHAPAASPSGL